MDGFSISLDLDAVPTLPDSPEPEPEVERELEPEPEPEPEPEAACEAPAARRSSARSKRDIAALVIEVRRRLVKGDGDLVIAEDLSLTPAEYRKVKAAMYEQAVAGFIDKPAEMQYVDYCLEQERCIKELEEMAKHFKSTKQYNAMVGAVRAKSQILGDMHKTGVAMGVIKKEASFDREVGGIRISELSNDDLRETIADGVRELQHIIDRFGDKPMTEVGTPSPLKDPSVRRVKH